LDALHIRDLMILECGRFDHRGQSNGIEIQTIDDAREWYDAHRDELSAVYSGGSIWEDPRPCVRNWVVWQFDLLPAEPRRRVVDDDELDETTIDAPSCTDWNCSLGGYESSYRYLRRRNLLTAAEVEAMQSPKMVEHVRRELEYCRIHMRPEGYTPHPTPIKLADIKLACDPRGEHELLTAEELEWGAPWLN
jgi:hypothetical protein